ncbi:tripartite tricarboxylate transporter substrate binding protein [Roseomonas sp. KE2513]|uniref:Bug family tripartite tricarboxylate transporter substrate binding protein n=1 Tax=Roseomonas sp. KE2513 TaxID=2479202 RepID=UPI0018DFD579|nr:tripartite tricarboxylate transporter substrate-binding protein [Roseomonas sp. KE2513]MBI0538555.1 tripartite tricarboxylate transporter substrate binding protein [Roseomonas sp. KE2513]
MISLSRRNAAQLLIAAGITAAPRAFAQAWPSRPVRIIVPFPPGQANDIFCRLLADKASEGRFRASRVVTENRPGAGGTIGMQAVARAAPDGYTLGFGSLASLAINPAIMRNMPYDAERDFVPVIRVFQAPLVLLVPKEGPRDAAELVQKLRAGGMNYGSSGPGSTQHMGSELFLQGIGAQAQHIPYRGSGPALTDLMAGSLGFVMESTASSIPLVRDGQLRALAVTDTARRPQLPEVPTMAEATGLQDVTTFGSGGIVAPAGTPIAVIEALYAAFGEAMRDPTVRARFEEQATTPLAEGPAEFAAFLKAEQAKWKGVAERGKIVIE